MMTLTDIECLKICGCSVCPNCGGFMLVHTKQSEENLITTSGRCDKCHKTFMVDRSYPAPYCILGGHSYNDNDK